MDYLLLCCALFVLSILFRLPALLNASGVHSDAAIVGLQARHILQGEWSWFLWGAGYQGSLDALMIALGFTITGATPLTLMAVPLIGHLLLTWFVFDLLRRRLGLGLAAVATLLVVFTPYAINGVALYAPRQWCITSVFAGIWLIDGAVESRRPLLSYAAGGMVVALSLYLDLYAVQFIPGVVFFAIACSFEGDTAAMPALRRIGACALAGLTGLFFVWLVRQSVDVNANTMALSFARIPVNLKLLTDKCLPWLLGYGVFIPWKNFYVPQPWHPLRAFHFVQIVGAALLMLAIVFGGLSVFIRDIPWPVRRSGLFGFIVSASSIAAFSVSVAPHDSWATRYLAPLVWTSPFAVAPLAYLLRTRRFAFAVLPYLIVAAVGGWVSFGLYLQGPLPIHHPRGVATEEAQLGEVLRAHGVKYAAADYWLAYRLTFLFGENPIVIPLNQLQDRYPPYRQGFEQAKRVALIFHPWVPTAQPEPFEAMFKQSRIGYERINVADFTIFIFNKPG